MEQSQISSRTIQDAQSNTRPSISRKTTYRLREVHESFDRVSLEEALRAHFSLQENEITVHSLAYDIAYGTLPRQKVATITFDTVPKTLETGDEWHFKMALQEVEPQKLYDVFLDTTFEGFTPLTPFEHEEGTTIDCILIHGWAGHPVGSFSSGNGHWFWPRDGLCHDIPTFCVWLYGYSSNLQDSNSTADVHDYADTFRRTLADSFGLHVTARPLVYIVHSLGGWILQDTITEIAVSKNSHDKVILERTSGALSFGVPVQGMEVEELRNLVHEDNLPATYNANLLDKRYGFRQRERQADEFYDACVKNKILIYTFYEREKTRTVRRDIATHRWTRDGPEVLLVEPSSATYGRLERQNKIPWKSNHMNMLKLRKSDEKYRVLLGRLREIQTISNNQSKREAKIDATSGTTPVKAAAPLNKEQKECLAKLHLTTPSLDKERIEKTAGSLFRDCYKWILDHDAFQKWRDGERELLWIKGDAGKGKTMLLCGIIDELTDISSVSYFFCQATYDKTNNSSTAVLRGLLWMLANQNPHLIQHITNETDHSSDSTYSSANSFYSLSKILHNMLQDVKAVIFIVDALDECTDGRNDLIDLIRKTSSRVKWLISSRNFVDIEERLRDTPKVSLEIEGSVGFAVQSYIKLRVSQLAEQKRYAPDLQTLILDHLSTHAQDTFLWCALVCNTLENTRRNQAKQVILESPATLEEIYKRMLESVYKQSDSEVLTGILATAACVYRPVSIQEIVNVMHLSEDDAESIEELIKDSGSFLTIRDGIVEFVHLSAQEHIKKHLLLVTKPESIHKDIYHCSMQTISRTLKRNIYELEDTCIHVAEVEIPEDDPLSSIAYCCLFWASHLQESGNIVSELSNDSCLANFLNNDFLIWQEAMCLLMNMKQAIYAMHLLHNITKSLPTNQAQEFISDARRFVLFFQDILADYPLQVYDTGLLFSPTNSLVRKVYASAAPTWATMSVNPLLEWPSSITEFGIDCTGRGVAAVYLSDSNHIAIGTLDRRVLFYDLVDGSLNHTLDLSLSFEVEPHNNDVLRNMAYHEAESSLLLLLCDTEQISEGEEHLKGDSSSCTLARWNLISSKLSVLGSFPNSCQLSPDAKYVIFEENHINKTSLRCYDILSNQYFTLQTQDTTDVDFTYAISGSAVAVWWQSDTIEVWNIQERSRIGIIECKQSSLCKSSWKDQMVLSTMGHLLAVCSNSSDRGPNSIKVFDVSADKWLWSRKESLPRTEAPDWPSCTFLKDTSCLMVNSFDTISIYDAYKGVLVGKTDVMVPMDISRVLHCGEQIAVIHFKTISLSVVPTTIPDMMPTGISYKLLTAEDNSFQVRIQDRVNLKAWYERRMFDTDRLVWKSPVHSELPSDESYRVLKGNYFIERNYDQVIISCLQSSETESRSTFKMPREAIMNFSPSGLYILFWRQKFTSIYNIRQDTTITSFVPATVIELLSDEVVIWPSDLEKSIRREPSSPQWAFGADRFIRQCDKCLLTWSQERGFEEISLEIKGKLALSCCGTWLASFTETCNYTVSSGLYDCKNNESHTHQIEIWHINSKKVKSTLNLPITEPYWKEECRTDMFFLPGKEQILTSGQDMELWSFTGHLGVRLFRLSKISYGFALHITRFISPTDLETNQGVLSLTNGAISFGGMDTPFIISKSIFINNRKILLLPTPYPHQKESIYSERRLVLGWHSNGVAVLQFHPNKISDDTSDDTSRSLSARAHKRIRVD